MIRLLFLFLSICLLSLEGIASVDFKLGGGFDRGVVEDGQRSKAENYGYSAEGHLLFSAFEPLYLGVFGYKNWSSTNTIYKGNNVNNFHISPQGAGAELALRFYSVMIKVGVGAYEADARRVEDGVGRNYKLTSGQGYHVGLEKRFALTQSMNWFIGAYTRNIIYSKIKMKNGGEPIDLRSKWEQTIYSVTVGFAFNFFYLDKGSSSSKGKSGSKGTK